MRVLLNLSKVSLLIFIISAVLLAVASTAIVLFIPTISSRALNNTADALFGDMGWISIMDKKLTNNGYNADMTVTIPDKLTESQSTMYLNSNVKGCGKGDKAVGSVDIGFGTDDVKHNVNLFYGKDTIAIDGLSTDESSKAIILPRNDVVKALDNSVFHPDSGSKYAMDRETYDRLCDALDKTDGSIEKELKAVFKAVRERSVELVETENYHYFVDGKFKLEKTIISTITYENICSLIDITAEEIKKTDLLKKAFENADVDIDEQAEKLKESFDEGRIVLSYVINDGRIVKFEFYNEEQRVGYLSKTKITAVFEYSDEGCVATINGSSSYKEGFDFVKDKFEIRYENKTYDTVTEITMDFIINTHNEEEQKSSISIDYDKEDGTYLAELIIPEGEVERRFGIVGSYKKYEKYSGFSFSIKDYTVDRMPMIDADTDLISISVKEDKSARKHTSPEGKNLFTMTEEEIDALIESPSAEKLKEIYDELTKYIPKTEDGVPIIDSAASQAALTIGQRYASYLSSTSSSDRVMKAYYYLGDYDIYVLLEYIRAYNYVEIKLYKNPGSLLNDYHILSIKDNLLEVHQYEVISVVDPSCITYGSITEKCIICNKQKTTKTTERSPHQYEVVSEVLADCLNSGYVTKKCTVCNYQTNATTDSSLGHLEGTVTINKSDNPDMLCDATITTCLRCDMFLSVAYGDSVCWYFNGGNNAYPSYDTQHFILPDQIIDYIDISTIQINLSNVDDHLLSVRVPNGCEVIKYQTFSAAHSLQLVVIPASVTEIEDGAFADPPNTIYYLGTEEDWAEVELNSYESVWSNVRIIFLPDGIEDAAIIAECVDTSKAENLLNEKKTLTESIDAAELLAENNESVSVIYTGRVELVAYDKLTDTISIAEVGESSTTITLMSSDGQIKGTFEVADVISIMDSDNGLLAMGSSSLGIIYLYDIEKGESSTFTFEKYECTFDHLYVDGDRVLFIADNKYSSEEYLYSFIPGGDCAQNGISTIGHEKYYFLREYHALISTDHINSQIILYNTADGIKIESTRGLEIYKNCLFSNGYIYAYYYYGNGFTDSKYAYIDHNLNETATRPESVWCELDIGYDSIEIQPIFASGNGRAAMILDVDGNISVALAGEGTDTTVIDYYAESGFATAEGDVILYTPGGYGIIMVETK